MIKPYHQPYRLNSASVTANARDLPVELWFLATADCEGRPFFLLSCVGHLESAGVTQLCWHRNSRPSCTRTIVAGRANAATINTNQANALRITPYLLAMHGPRFKSLRSGFFGTSPPRTARQLNWSQRSIFATVANFLRTSRTDPRRRCS